MALVDHKIKQEEADKRSAELAANTTLPGNPSEWHKRKTLVFDLETTGVNVEKERIVTASILEIYGSPFSPESVVVREWLVKPSKAISPGAAAIHGITDELAAEFGMPPEQAIQEIVSLLRENMLAGVPVLAYNASFDFTLLDREAKREGVEPLKDEELIIIDPLVLDYKFSKYRKGSRKLIDVVQHYGMGKFEAHNSSADCLATAQLAYQMAQHYYGSDILLAPETLHSIQINWKQEWARGRNQWAVSQGRKPTYSGSLGIAPEK